MSNYMDYDFDVQNIYLSGQHIQGVQSVNTDFEYPDKEVWAAGVSGPVSLAMEGNLEGGFTFERVLVEDDPVTGFFEQGASGCLAYGEDKAYVFEKGMLSNYSFEAEIGSIPTLGATFSTWGETETKSDYPMPSSESINIPIISAGDLEVIVTNCFGGAPFHASSELIESISFDVSIDWQPINSLASLVPAGFYAKQPSVIMVEIHFEVNEFKSPNFADSLCSPVLKNITINAKKCEAACSDKSSILRSFQIPSAQLISYHQESDIDSVLMGHATFKSVILNPGTMKKIFQ